MSLILTVNLIYQNQLQVTKSLDSNKAIGPLGFPAKIYEIFLHENLTNYVNTFLSKFIYSIQFNFKSYSTNHVLICWIENWKKSLDKKKIVGAVLMDLSKAFNPIPHDLLIAKMYAYGFSINVTFFYSYLKRWNQIVRINNTHSVFQVLLSGVPKAQYLVRFFSIYL